MTNFTPREIKLCFEEDALVTALLMLHWWKRSNFSATFSTKEKLHLNADLNSEIDYRFKLSLWNEIRSMEQVYMPNATAPLIEPIVCSKSFYEDHELVNNNKFQRYILEGKYSHQYRNLFGTDVQFPGIIHHSKSLTYIQVIDFGNLIADSSKLRELDLILKEKKKNGDKVLIFCQMTKMIDILEDFMNLRKYTFFRLDGASNIADRRDMVNDFQKPQSKVFVFLLSTRAGTAFTI
jgi:SNF2 family DNA or RNA helicase